jgi:hypothetical protein
MSTDANGLTYARTGSMTTAHPPLLLPVIAAEAGAPGVVGSIVEQLLGLVAQRYTVTVAPAVIPSQVEADLETWLNQANQLMLVSFGPTATTALQALLDTIHDALQRAAGEDAHQQVLPLPSAVPDRPVLSPLEGVACPQRQLAPLVSQFPGWQGTYLCLEAGGRQIILTCGQPRQVGQCRTTSASTIISSLAAALLGQDGPLKRDGEILASYLQSLVGAVLRQVFHSESTISAVPSPFLLPPWLAGARD